MKVFKTLKRGVPDGASTAQVGGLGCLTVAGFMLSSWIGLVVLGLALLFVGWALDGET